VAFGLSIITCDRRPLGKCNYLAVTWASLIQANVLSLGQQHICLFDAGPGADWAAAARQLTGCQVLEGPMALRLSAAQNAHRALEWHATRDTFGMFMEDDVEVRSDLLPILADGCQRVSPPAGAIVFGANYSWTALPENSRCTWAPYAATEFYGTWAMVLRPDTCAAYLQSKERAGADAGLTPFDLAFGAWCQRTRTAIVAHCPNLARHVGLQSIAGDDHPPMAW